MSWYNRGATGGWAAALSVALVCSTVLVGSIAPQWRPLQEHAPSTSAPTAVSTLPGNSAVATAMAVPSRDTTKSQVGAGDAATLTHAAETAVQLREQQQRRQQAEAEVVRQQAAQLQEQSRVERELSAAKGQLGELEMEKEKLRKQLQEAEARRKQLEEDNQALRSQQSQLERRLGQLEGEVRGQWNDILSAATADKDALKKYLESHPHWLEQRRAEEHAPSTSAPTAVSTLPGNSAVATAMAVPSRDTTKSQVGAGDAATLTHAAETAVQLREQQQRRQQAEAEVVRQQAAQLQEQSRVERELSAAKGQLGELEMEKEKLRKQLQEAEARRKQLEEDNQALRSQQSQLERRLGQLEGEVRGQWNDILSAATADKDALKKYLESHPHWLEQRRAEIQRLPQRGIVIAAANAALNANAFVNVYLLRHHLGCTLPITISYWGEEEHVGDSLINFFSEHQLNVSFLDSSRLTLPPHQRPLAPRRLDGRFFGWKPKIAAIYTVPYQEILFLDADSMPLMDPGFLFDWPDYAAKGNIIFPEHHRKEVKLFRHFGLHNPWADAGKKAEWPLVEETGQLLLNRPVLVHADMLEWLWFLNTHDEVTYRLGHGDCDTFRAAFDLAGKRESYYQSPHPSADGLKDTGSQDLRYFKYALVQLAPNGSVMFAHRVWFNKYDPTKDELRTFDYLTVENSGGRADVMRARWGLSPSQARIVPQSECSMHFEDMPRSQKACGLDPEDETVPIPIFPVSEASYVGQALRGGDTAFKLLRAALTTGKLALS
ncbi:hypothetical protein N2152v2_000770 [Parachlorella kessleri]